MNENVNSGEAVINWDTLNNPAEKYAKDSSNMATFYVVFINSHEIKENYDIEMMDEVSSHSNFQDAFKAYAKLRIENPDRLTAVVMVGEDNIPSAIIPKAISLANKDGSSVFLVRGENGVDMHLNAKSPMEEWALKKKYLMSE
jgi:hypothetical protein